MKHTIKGSVCGAVVVTDQWLGGDEAFLSVIDGGECTAGISLSDEGMAALIFALETALEMRETRRERDRVLSCAGSKLCSAPAVACETPISCGVAA